MPRNMTLKTRLLSSALILNLGGLYQAASAQDAGSDEPAFEEIVVTGLRASLINSVGVKRDADVVVDAITAEDIGKFPDQNVAESLQRITGVTIDRSGGEGQLLTVRGMGPEFNAVLLNGRTLATTSGGRAFNFDILASELINGAEVFKTQSAELQEGAIGATVNITTLKPLSFPGFQAVGSTKALYDGMTEKVRPQFSGLISNTFADDTFGVLASFSYYNRKSRYDQANTASYFKTTDDLDGVNYGEVYFPRNYDQIAQTEARERISGTLVLQYRPTDTLEVTVDGIYSRLDLDYRQDVLPHWFETGTIRNPVLDENNTVVKADFEGTFVETLVRQSSSRDDLLGGGLNVDWQVNDRWNMVVDVSKSRAESDPKQGYSDTVAGRPGDFSYDRSSGDLVPTITYAAFDENAPLTAGWASLQGTQIKDEVLEAKVDNSYEFSDGLLSEIRFGGHYSDRTLGSTWGETEYPLPWIFGDNSTRVVLPMSLFRTYDSDGFLSGASGSPTQSWLTFNSDELFAFLTSEEALSQLDDPDPIRELIARTGGFDMVADPAAYKVNEELMSLYADAHLEGELGSMPWSAVLGLRYVRTASTSIGRQVALVDLINVDPSKPNQVVAIESDDYVPVRVKNTYSDFLPSINAKLDIRDNLIGRLAWSKSLTRPELDQMSPLTSYSGGEIGQLTASGSNPLLMPYKSNNFDASLEWYYSEGSYVALAGFYKDVDGYLGTGEVKESVTVPSGTYEYEVSRPINLDSTKIKGLEIAVQHMFTSLPSPFDGIGITANMTFVDSSSSTDVPGEKLPLIGLSNSQNLILFYEKGPLSFRIAYNNRDRFLQSKPRSNRDGHYVDDYYQVDVSASYAINDNFSIFLEGINVTNELYIKNAEFKNQTLEVTETGPRYTVGIRGKF
ncbi:TonB-dependent receptor [Pseudokordiimonas caeni]|uniref:TonB-dependent receptor n=1 Tax=Pseudokordiimonas caeni TaxID=2997908 RepID=UPI002810CC43|nr:TonB-dependent receptor [Pseudokordiimonas caeni]